MLEPLEGLGTDPKPGLERIKKFMGAIGNPQDDLRIILIGGTNGKGSTTAYLSNILQDDGYKVGSFFSPHTVSPTERIQINGKWIEESELVDYEEDVLRVSGAGYPITYWEGLAALAYKYFRDRDVDFAVVEVMMGGRYDATNVAYPAISIITNVSRDHTDFLGEEIEKIAWEKAGIIKGNLAITAVEEGFGAIKKEVEETDGRLRKLGKDFFCEKVGISDSGNIFDYLGYEFYKEIKTKMIGDYQVKNAALAIAAAEEMGVSEDSVKTGIERTMHPGRIQVISKKPLVIVDAAHNPEGIGNLVANLHLFDYENLSVLFSAKKTKDWKKMISLVAPHASHITATEFGEGSVPAENLSKEAMFYTKSSFEKNPSMAFDHAAQKGDALLVCGSIYLIRKLAEEGKINI